MVVTHVGGDVVQWGLGHLQVVCTLDVCPWFEPRALMIYVTIRCVCLRCHVIRILHHTARCLLFALVRTLYTRSTHCHVRFLRMLPHLFE